jgi:hypothetical protein
LIDSERQACSGRLAARLAQAGLGQEPPGPEWENWAALFTPLAEEWRDVDLEPHFQQISSYIKSVLPQGSSLNEERQPIPPFYGCEANLVQAILFLMDFALMEMQPGGQLQWRVFPRPAGGVDLELSFPGQIYRQEDISKLLQPFKTMTKLLSPLGPYLAAAIAQQHGGSLVIQPNPGGGLSLRLGIPDGKGAGMVGGRGENSGVA